MKFIRLEEGRFINLERIAYIHPDGVHRGRWCASVDGHDDDYIPLSEESYAAIVRVIEEKE
jgi:hypothetical protein